jgi:hypothetical protein
VLLARTARTRIIAADLGAGTHHLHHRRVMVMAVVVPVVAVGAVDVGLVPMVMAMIMVMVAVGAMHMRLAMGRTCRLFCRILGHRPLVLCETAAL